MTVNKTRNSTISSVESAKRRTTHPGTRSTQSPQPLERLKTARMPSCVPTTVFAPPRIGTMERSSSSWSSECAIGVSRFARTSITERVPSPLCIRMSKFQGQCATPKSLTMTNLVTTSCRLSAIYMKSEMKSKWCVYSRSAFGVRGSHSCETVLRHE